MRNLLSDNDIRIMRKKLNAETILPPVAPSIGQDIWNVHRILDTLEYFRDVEEKYNSSLNSDPEKRREG